MCATSRFLPLYCWPAIRTIGLKFTGQAAHLVTYMRTNFHEHGLRTLVARGHKAIGLQLSVRKLQIFASLMKQEYLSWWVKIYKVGSDVHILKRDKLS